MGIHYIIFANLSSFENFCNKKLFKKKTTLESFLQRNLTLKQEEQSAMLKIERRVNKLRLLHPFPGESLECLCGAWCKEEGSLQILQLMDGKHNRVQGGSSHPTANLFALILAAACKIWFHDQGLNPGPLH